MATYISCFKEKFHRSWRLILLIFTVLVIFAVGEGPWDPIADWYRHTGQNPLLLTVATGISRWGDFWPGGLAICLILFGLGCFCNRRRVRHAAVIALAAALLAGSCSLILKATLGRARPHIAIAARLDDQFHGLAWSDAFHSFPSGHTTTAFAVAMVFILLLPRVGWFAFPVALAVGWSRMYVGAHYFGDVLTGAWIGSLTAWLLVASFRDWEKKRSRPVICESLQQCRH